MNIVALSDDIESNISKIRLTIPLQAVAAKKNWNFRAKSIYSFSIQDVTWGDVFIIQRAANQRVLRIARRLKKEAKIVIYEIDDLLTEMPNFLLSRRSERQRNFIFEMGRVCDFVSTTNARLGGKITQERGNFFLTPNYAYPYPLGRANQNSQDIKATLMVAASDSILLDFMLPALKRIDEKYNHSVRIISIGHTSKAIKSAGIETEAYAIMPHAEFMRFISCLANPIGLLPLDDSEFSACKSPVKYFDYSIAGLVSVASDVPPYNDVIRPGETGLLAKNNAESWFFHVCNLIDQPLLRQRMAATALCSVQSHHLLPHNTSGWEQGLANVQVARRGQTLSSKLLVVIDPLFVGLRRWNRRRLSSRKGKL